jgi:hypothetical protein
MLRTDDHVDERGVGRDTPVFIRPTLESRRAFDYFVSQTNVTNHHIMKVKKLNKTKYLVDTFLVKLF